MTKSLKTVVMPDGATSQILTSKTFTHAVVYFNPYYDGWTVKRWEESWPDAVETQTKLIKKLFKELGVKNPSSLSVSEEDQVTNKIINTYPILELNIHQPNLEAIG